MEDQLKKINFIKDVKTMTLEGNSVWAAGVEECTDYTLCNTPKCNHLYIVKSFTYFHQDY